MNIQEAVIEQLKIANPDVTLNTDEDMNHSLRDLGFDSIQFLGIVMGVCDTMGIDVTNINSMEISTENNVFQFIDNFRPLVPAETATA